MYSTPAGVCVCVCVVANRQQVHTSASARFSVQAGGVLKERHRVTLQRTLFTWDSLYYGLIYSDLVSGITSRNSMPCVFREWFCFTSARICLF